MRQLSPTGRVGHLQVFEMKVTLRQHLFTKVAEELNINDEVRARVREKLADIPSYRKHVQPYDDQPPLPLEWKKGWPHSAELFLLLVEQAYASAFRLEGRSYRKRVY